MKKIILFFTLYGLGFAQFPTNVPNNNYYGVFTTGVSGTLNAIVAVNDTSAYIINGSCTQYGLNTPCTSVFVSNMLIGMGNEIAQICSVSAGPGNTTLLQFGHSTCPNIDGRGFGGSTAVIAYGNTKITSSLFSYSYSKIISELPNIENYLNSVFTISGTVVTFKNTITQVNINGELNITGAGATIVNAGGGQWGGSFQLINGAAFFTNGGYIACNPNPMPRGDCTIGSLWGVDNYYSGAFVIQPTQDNYEGLAEIWPIGTFHSAKVAVYSNAGNGNPASGSFADAFLRINGATAYLGVEMFGAYTPVTSLEIGEIPGSGNANALNEIGIYLRGTKLFDFNYTTSSFDAPEINVDSGGLVLTGTLLIGNGINATLQCLNCVDDNGFGGANNWPVSGTGVGPTLSYNTRVTLYLNHSLQAGTNYFTYQYGVGSKIAIVSHRNLGNITVGYSIGTEIDLCYDGVYWEDMSQ